MCCALDKSHLGKEEEGARRTGSGADGHGSCLQSEPTEERGGKEGWVKVGSTVGYRSVQRVCILGR